MHLRKGILTHVTNGEQILIGVGAADFRGFARSNETAAFITDCLKADVTRDEIVDRLEAEYDAPRDVLERDTDKILEILRSVNAIED